MVVFRWDPDPNVFNAGFEIRYAPITAATFDSAVPVTEVTKGTSITTAIIPPGDWRFYIVGVNDATGKYSENPATLKLTLFAREKKTGYASLNTGKDQWAKRI